MNIVADENYTLSEQERTHLFINELISDLKESYTQKQIIQLFSNTTKTAEGYITKTFSSDAIHTIEVVLKKTSQKRQGNKLEAYKYGKELLSQTKAELNQLKSIVGTSDLQYKMLADNVAKETLQCAIDYFNENDERESNGDYLEQALELANSAQTIAVKDMTKDRIKDNIQTLEGMKERELNRAIAILKSIKEAYDINKAEIMLIVREKELDMGYGQSINWDKVNDFIQDSLNWNKITELIQEDISRKDIEKIKDFSNTTKKEEFKSLVNYIISKMPYSKSNRISYLKYWETQRTTTKSTTTNDRTTFSPYIIHEQSNENESTWIWWVIGIIIVATLMNHC